MRYTDCHTLYVHFIRYCVNDHIICLRQMYVETDIGRLKTFSLAKNKKKVTKKTNEKKSRIHSVL